MHNTGIGDAFNLGCKLVCVIQGRSAPRHSRPGAWFSAWSTPLINKTRPIRCKTQGADAKRPRPLDSTRARRLSLHGAVAASQPRRTRPRGLADLGIGPRRLRRQTMTAAIGLGEAGRMDGLALGWVVIAADHQTPLIMQKLDCDGGFMSYIAFVPGREVGVFLAVDRVDFAMF